MISATTSHLFPTIHRINPIKILLHVFPSLSKWHLASACVGMVLYIFLTAIKEILAFGTKIFFRSILSIFFRDIQVIGRENIPREGQPVIFSINHANQFMDGVMVYANCMRNVSYLVAEVSWQRKIVGDIAWAMDAVPVRRAQDSAQALTSSFGYIGRWRKQME